jgi:hypothetical protein
MEGIMNRDNSPHDLKSLWQNQAAESFTISVEELRKASHKFTRKIFWRNIREYLAAAIVILGYGYYIYRFSNVIVRLGSVLIMAAAVWVAFRLHKRGSSRAMALDMDAQSCVDFHRAELVRQHDLLSNIWKWYLMPFAIGLAVFLIGLLQMALSRPGARLHYGDIAVGYGVAVAACAGVFAFIAKLNRWAARKLQKQIDALDALKQPPD